MNLARIIEDHDAGSPALISRGLTTTYGELRDQVAAVRGGLHELGIGPDDRVALLCANNWYFVVSYLAILGLGGVAVPLNPSSPARAVERELRTVDAAGVVVGPAGRSCMVEVDRSAVPLVVGCPGVELDNAVSLDDLLESDPVAAVERDADDLAALMFTSGTAGTPKAAMLTHGNLLTNLAQTQAHEGRDQTADDVVFGILPFSHIFGLNVVLAITLQVGGSLLLVERFDPSTALDAIDKHGVTVLSGPPALWSALASMPEARPEDVASVRLAVSGAAKLPNETAELVRERLGIEVKEGYGLTECSPVVTNALGTDAPTGSVGIPVPGLEVRLVDTDGTDVLIGDTGEVWVRGPNVFKGYLGDPEATARALTDDGWLRTGDLAVVDDKGYLYLVDRMKDLIIVSGFNVFPAEVEEVLIEHPRIDAVAVVGVPHPHSGEAVKAYVVVGEGAIEEDDVVAFCAEYLPSYKCPTKVVFVDEIPRGLGGKVLRRALR
ncbi:MAG: AMP-binding protein [Acidimicrobiales bacterium]